MNNKQHQLAVQEAVKGKFKGRQELRSRFVPHYPESAEREFKRVTNAYIRILKKSLETRLPALLKEYKREQRTDSRFDSSRDLEGKVSRELQKVAEDMEQKLARFGFDSLVRKVAQLTQANSLREWKRICQQVLGIDLIDDYYSGDFYADALQRWVADNISKIKSIPNETLGSMREIILNGFRHGDTITKISKAIQEEYGLTRRKAQMLARDQVSTLNAEITKHQQEDAGVKKYKWSSSKDSRVRDCHRALDGKFFNWDDPPEMWYETKSRGRVYTGRRCHPGEDYCCRCVAIPVFEIKSVDLPIKTKEK